LLSWNLKIATIKRRSIDIKGSIYAGTHITIVSGSDDRLTHSAIERSSPRQLRDLTPRSGIHSAVALMPPPTNITRSSSYTSLIVPITYFCMERGLMWLPLLGAFIWLARAGSNEYQKIEAYKRWAVGFDRCKYDIYAVMGLKDREISWGKPTKNEPKDLQTFSLDRIQRIQLIVDNRIIDLDNLPLKGKKIDLRFESIDPSESIEIPFTEVPMAAEWGKFLKQSISKSE
jgi:hypothetical protein